MRRILRLRKTRHRSVPTARFDPLAARRIRDLYAQGLEFTDILTREFLQCHLSCSGGRPMDVVYIGLAVVFWLLLAGMARGCALLAGGNRP